MHISCIFLENFLIRNWSHIATHLVLVLCSCWSDRLLKSLRLRRFKLSNRIGMKFGRNVLEVNTHRLTDSHFRFDIRISRCRSWRHFTQKSAAAWWVNSMRFAGIYAAAPVSSWSIVHSYLFLPVRMMMRFWMTDDVYVQEIRELLFWFTRKTPVDAQKAQASHYFKMLLEPETFPAGQQQTFSSYWYNICSLLLG